MLKHYIVNGYEFQFEEGKQPAGAVELKAAAKPNKAKKPENKEGKPDTAGKVEEG